nr:MAG: ORF1 [TTV-like mini virus]
MPPYQRYWNYYRRRNPWRRTFRFRRRRPRKTFRRKYRRRYKRVRRRRYKNFFKRKLKTLNIVQWQPNHIKKCKIQGYIQLFGGGCDRIVNNFAMYKDSIVPWHEPGGGGWSIQELSLCSLYTQNQMLQNWWTKSNRGLNMCRYLRCKLTLYRQEQTDYIFNYNIEPPYSVSKYYYAGFHPYRMLLYNKRIVVPSLRTDPNNKRRYIKRTIKPPREIKNQWYFQQNFCTLPLLQFSAVACSLNSMYIPPNSISNNITVNTLNTSFFQHPRFQYPKTGQYGYVPKDGTYIYGSTTLEPNMPNWQNQTIQENIIYLGDTMINDEGHPIKSTTTGVEQYNQLHWGNPFYHRYLDGSYICFISSKDLNWVITNKTKKISDMQPQLKTQPFIIKCRYNPYKDTGKGNVAYWVSNLDAQNWEPPQDPDLQISDFPLWIMLWGWEEFTEKLNKIRVNSGNYMLVIRTKAFSETLPAYVLLSDSFRDGRAPYDRDADEILPNDYGHWYPRWKFQKEAISALLKTGPAVCKCENQKAVQAHLKYNFFFKWGGNPAEMENVYDPMAQPVYPMPNNQLFQTEIVSPETSIQNLIYNFDTRHDMLTKQATKRIKEISSDDDSLFSDGAQHSTDPPLRYQTTPQEKTTKEKEKETTLQQQLNLIQQYNQQLRQRLQQLKQLI